MCVKKINGTYVLCKNNFGCSWSLVISYPFNTIFICFYVRVVWVIGEGGLCLEGGEK